MTRADLLALAARVEAAADPFARIVRLNAPLDLPDDMPLARVLPGVWPKMGDLRRLVEAVAALRAMAEGAGE